jgi:hypothetical protein
VLTWRAVARRVWLPILAVGATWILADSAGAAPLLGGGIDETGLGAVVGQVTDPVGDLLTPPPTTAPPPPAPARPRHPHPLRSPRRSRPRRPCQHRFPSR